MAEEKMPAQRMEIITLEEKAANAGSGSVNEAMPNNAMAEKRYW